MLKNIIYSFLGLLLLNVSACFADITAVPSNVQMTTKSVDKVKDDADNTYNVNGDFNFDSTLYLTDEQIEDSKNIDKIEDNKTGFSTRVINSSHFSSGTATKTWIPINKIQK